MVNFTFVWPKKDTEQVFLKGSFDGWKSKIPLVKQPDGTQSITFPLKEEDTDYKFIVDGKEVVDKTKIFKTSSDTNSEVNVLSKDALTNLNTIIKSLGGNGASPGGAVPEAGGLSLNAGKGQKLDYAELCNSAATGNLSSFLSMPGIALPSNVSEIKEFSK